MLLAKIYIVGMCVEQDPVNTSPDLFIILVWLGPVEISFLYIFKWHNWDYSEKYVLTVQSKAASAWF